MKIGQEMQSFLKKLKKKDKGLTEKGLIEIFEDMANAQSYNARRIGEYGLEILENKLNADSLEYKKLKEACSELEARNSSENPATYSVLYRGKMVNHSYPRISVSNTAGMVAIKIEKPMSKAKLKQYTDYYFDDNGEYLVTDVDFSNYMNEFKELVNIHFQIDELQKDLTEYYEKYSENGGVDEGVVDLVKEKIANGHQFSESILENIREKERISRNSDTSLERTEHTLSLFNKAMSVDF